MGKPFSINRRGFMAAAGAVAWTAKSYASIKGANDRLNMAFIGCGGMASHHLGALLGMREEENLAIRAVCDAYKTRAQQFQERIKSADAGKAKVFQDFEDVLEMKDLDYVLIATPEHSHGYLTLAALDAGKHVYCEKPMTHDISESFDVLAKAESTGLKLQIGVQGMADDSYSSALDAIKEGLLGPVVEAQIDYVRNYPADKGPWRTKVDPNMAKPKDLNWERWVRPGAERPWSPNHYFEWRCYSDYSGGIASDLFVHRITRLIKACGLQFPDRVIGMGGIYLWPDGRDLPDSFEMIVEYPACEGITPGMTVHVLGTMANETANKHCIRGHQGTLTFTEKGWEITDQRSGQVIRTHEKTGAEDVTPHHKNHHEAIRNGAELNCPPELGLYGVVATRMANLSWFKRKLVTWDGIQKKVIPT